MRCACDLRAHSTETTNPRPPAMSLSASAASASASVLATQQQNQLVVQIIHDAEAASTAAKRVASAGAEKLRKLERAWEKLSAAQIELHHQSRDSEASLLGLHSRVKEFDEQAERLRADFQIHKDELQRILDNLAARPLAACLQAAHSPTPPPLPPPASDGSVHPPSSLSRGSSQPSAAAPPLQTLFDFIDLDSLNLVHSHFLHSMAELARVAEQSRAEVIAKPEGMMVQVREMEMALTEKMSAGTGVAPEVVAANLPPMPADASASAASMSSAASASNAAYLAACAAEDPSVLGQCRAAFHALEAEVNAIPELFSAMCRSYDRVRQARQQAAAAAAAATQANTGAAAASPSASAAAAAAADVVLEINTMQSLLLQIHARASRAQSLLGHMDRCNSVHSVLYSSTLDLYQHLERLGPALQTSLAAFQSLELSHSSLSHSATTAIQELHNLSLFYAQFERSYDALLEEIQRRHSANAALTALVSHVRLQLSEAYHAEVTDREAFQSNFGKYLPPSLCPAIFEPIVEFKVVPTEDPLTELPVHVPTEGERERGKVRREGERMMMMQQHEMQHQQQQIQLQQQSQHDLSKQPQQQHYDGLSPPQLHQHQLQSQLQSHPPSQQSSGLHHAHAPAAASHESQHDLYAQYGGLPPSSALMHSATQPLASAAGAGAASASLSVGPGGPVPPLDAGAPSVHSHPRTLSQPAPHVKPVAPKGFGDDD